MSRNQTKWRSHVVAVAVAFMALAPRAAAAQDNRVDVTGKWLFSVTTDAGTGTPTLTFKQTGDSLTGHYSSQLLGEAELKGTVKAGKITFTVNVEVQGTSLAVVYTGTVDSKDAMKGSVDLGGQGAGSFTGKRQSP